MVIFCIKQITVFLFYVECITMTRSFNFLIASSSVFFFLNSSNASVHSSSYNSENISVIFDGLQGSLKSVKFGLLSLNLLAV